MAAVLPVWTSMIVYYVEGDFGHLMNEVSQKPRWRTKVRGHCFSFIMPWEDIVKDLNGKMTCKDLAAFPRDEDCLSYMLSLHLKVAGKDFHQHLKQVHLRPFVLVLLLHELIEKGHPVFDSSLSARVLKDNVERAVYGKYPEQESDKKPEDRQGCIPARIRAMMEEQSAKASESEKTDLPTTLRKMVTFEKHAVPGDAAKRMDEALEDVRPSSFVLDKTATSCTDAATVRAGALSRYGELHVGTGNTFLNQWKTEYTSLALPFVIPRAVSGPDYEESKRWRRRDDESFKAPMVTPDEFLRGFPKRVERQIVTDWTAVPIVQSVWFKYTVEHLPLAVTGFPKKRSRPLEDTGKEYTEAMRKLYRVLSEGFTECVRDSNGVVRAKKMPIAGDVTKLPFAQGLTEKEKELARKVASVATKMPGTPHVRRMMGQAHFGARIFYGDTLFITISPNPQHSAAVLTLSRSRKKRSPFERRRGGRSSHCRFMRP